MDTIRPQTKNCTLLFSIILLAFPLWAAGLSLLATRHNSAVPPVTVGMVVLMASVSLRPVRSRDDVRQLMKPLVIVSLGLTLYPILLHVFAPSLTKAIPVLWDNSFSFASAMIESILIIPIFLYNREMQAERIE